MEKFKFELNNNEIVITCEEPQMRLSAYELQEMPYFAPDNALGVFCTLTSSAGEKHIAFLLNNPEDIRVELLSVHTLIIEAVNWFCKQAYQVLPEVVEFTWMYKYMFVDMYSFDDLEKHNCKPFYKYPPEKRIEILELNRDKKAAGWTDEEIISMGESIENEIEYTQDYSGPEEWLPVAGKKAENFEGEKLPF